MSNTNTKDNIPTLVEWIGGESKLQKLTEIFYDKVLNDALVGPLFQHMQKEHPKYVAYFITEVFGGEKTYTNTRGGHPHMLGQHLNKNISEEQRKRWVQLLMESADEAGLPDDPEFRSAFASYIEWGSRLAVMNSHGDVEVDPNQPMPHWGWGEVGGPYKK